LSVPHPAPRDRGFELIHLDDSLLAANKPAGLLAVPGRGEDKQDCLVARVQAEFPDALTVHRLDMATSGLILFARGADMQSRLSRMFRERLIEKRYVALVAGKMTPETGEIALPLIADWPNRPRQKVDHDSGKPSLTRYRLLGYDAGSDTSHVELEPVTGRTHQLRVHLLSVGHPIVGDALYGGRPAERLMLHACLLSFAHPLSGQPLILTSDPPFRALTDAILSPA
jgi:tRNA pseudouridine32 synthase/23S rRNA pseudouridine746 synthase